MPYARVLLFIPTLLVATVLVFTLFWIVPGDPALTILAGGEGDTGSVSPEQLQQLRQALGLDRPLYVQYGSWLGNVLRGDLGTSLWYKTPVWDQLKDRFFVTMELAVMAILLAFCVAVPLGVISAVKQDNGVCSWPPGPSARRRHASSRDLSCPTAWPFT